MQGLSALILMIKCIGLGATVAGASGEAKLYFAGDRGIGRVNLDGSDFEMLIESDERRPRDLAIDRLKEKLYWTFQARIYRSNLDGSELELFAGPLRVEGEYIIDGFYITIDSENRLMFLGMDINHGSYRESFYGGLYIDTWSNEPYKDGQVSHPMQEGNLFPMSRTSAFDHPIDDEDVDSTNDEFYWAEWTGVAEFRRSPLSDAYSTSTLVYTDESSRDIYDIVFHNGEVFWVNGRGSILRLELDEGRSGGSVHEVFAPLVREPRGIHVDKAGGRILWTDPLSGVVMQADLDGRGRKAVSFRTKRPQDVISAEDRIYWSERDVDSYRSTLWSASRDGSDLQEVSLPRDANPVDLDYDSLRAQLYWSEPRSASGGDKCTLSRANIDGSGLETIEPGLCPDDFSVDGKKGVVYIAGLPLDVHHSQDESGVWMTDFSSNQSVHLVHYSSWVFMQQCILYTDIGVYWGQLDAGMYREPVFLQVFRIDPSNPGALPAKIFERSEEGPRSIISRIALYLPDEVQTGTVRAEGRPLATDLHLNYPNPFNSSTKIPYTVSQDGPVSLTIYNTLGQPVASLVKDTRQEGSYEAVWSTDGEESLASGVYLARLVAGDAVKVRRLTLLR